MTKSLTNDSQRIFLAKMRPLCYRNPVMIEIELKAHVDDRLSLSERLNSFATYAGRVIRDDEYYGRSRTDPHKIRLRREQREEAGSINTSYLLTYKRKELRNGADGIAIEVNDEKECSLSSPEAVTTFLEDAGYAVQLKKHKDVQDWTLELPSGSVLAESLTATFELCTVPPLGDFLEIEILCPLSDEESTAKVRNALQKLLAKTGIPPSRIERRYYSEMLAHTI